ncbi:transport and Golgi organization protein 6 homolog isoform X1 [Anguilla anguilla]|uniref:transport and Golgi organization protein 6 homolog isoform X1 n=1 Tax=Anguilla anguilla TaxID=7936 RepID=UPI0015AA528A|nr:transport and Golgi organization protein 6 homolog isoform X1 [Anguilla anguilla]
MTAAIVEALCILTKPAGDSHVNSAQSSQQGALLHALQSNLEQLEARLLAEPGLVEARALRDEVRLAVAWYQETQELTWRFTQECLLLLLGLARHLSRLLEAFHPAVAPPGPCLPEMAPPLPPDVLSVSQQKTVGAVLQFVVTLGLCPYLAPGVGLALGRRLAFGAAVEGAVLGGGASDRDRRLLTTTCSLLELAELPSLATLIFTRHLGDVMAGLCQLGYRPHRPEGANTESDKGISMEERLNCRKALQGILGKVYQPIVIKELLILQGGPKQAPPTGRGGGGPRQPLAQALPWLRRLCGQLLSERLMQPSGVQAVVRAVLEGAGGGGAGSGPASSDWRKCDMVARVLAACPQQALSVEEYYSQVCPQVLELLHFPDKLTALQFQRVATRAALTMLQERPELAQQHLLTPLLAPLAHCGVPTEGLQVPESVPEWELTRCIEDVYKVWVVGNSPCPALLKALGETVPVLFSLYCFTKQSVCHLRAPCEEILQWYFSHSEPPEALSALKQLCNLQTRVGGVVPGFQFAPGSEGGARLIPREQISDEDEALYEKVSGEQWRVECLVQLLAEMKDKDLPGDFFLELLEELTGWAAEEEVEEEQEVDTSAMTLLELEEHLLRCAEGRSRRLALLQVLAAVCEGLSHTLLLRKPTQVVGFVVSLLERACVALARGSDSPVESQTLSMAMGLLATMLTGDMQLNAQDYASMSLLLPPLDFISQKHPEIVIQELASDLRAAIATHGAFCPDTVAQASHARISQKTRSTATSQVSCNKDTATPQLAQDTPMSPITRNTPTPQTSRTTVTPQITRDTPTPQTSRTTVTPQITRDTSAPQTSHNAPGTDLRTAGASAGENESSSPSGTVRSPVGAGCHVTGAAGGAGGRVSGGPPPAPPASGAFSECLLEACDPDVPTRAVALRSLTRALQERRPEALQAQDRVLTLFLENLNHEDSFVYLSAIQGLAVLADSSPETVLQRLLEEFQGGATGPSPGGRLLETRLKAGEVLMRASRALGDLAPHHGRPLIGVFLRGVRDVDPTIRASSLSNLGELCQRLNFSLGPLTQELNSCLTALVKTEREVEVRRAAVHVIALLLRGLSDKTTQVLGDVLLDLYRALKWVVRMDRDDVTVLHAQLALEELDDVMKKFLFPAQKLEKKIVVLP